MNITLNVSDFQSLQDQLVDLKTKNYELTEKNRRSQADFEALKDKICNQQLKIEEQERNFESASTTLRRELEALGNNKENENYKAKYKKLLQKAKELQSRYDKSLELIQQLKAQQQNLSEKLVDVQTEADSLLKRLNEIESDDETIKSERDRLRNEVENFDNRLAIEANERKISERKATQIIKDLKRQLALETSRSETLQNRLEQLLSNGLTTSEGPELVQTRDGEMSIASSTNENGSSNGQGSKTNQDSNSISSWGFVDTVKTSNPALNDSLSLCSIHSEDRETVQHPEDNSSEKSSGKLPVNSTPSKPDRSSTPAQIDSERIESLETIISLEEASRASHSDPNNSGMLQIEEQAALVDRVAQLQHDKWILEEKLSYLEQTNSTLSEDLANKSDIIKRYFMDQASRSSAIIGNHTDARSASSSNSFSGGVNAPSHAGANNHNRRTSLSNNLNHILLEKPSFKKVVDFLKERGQVNSTQESETISREAMKRMQIMLEETLIKCLKLEESLDMSTSDGNKQASQS